MSQKNLLGDTDSSGHDKRFYNSIHIGRVTEVVCTDKQANVRVLMPDKVDHEGTPLITKPVPVLQVASTAKKSFAVPRVGTNVVLLKMPNGTSDYLVVGSFYTETDPPPVQDPKLDYVIFDDGSTMQFDPSTGTLTWKLKGDIVIETDGKVSIQSDGDIMLNAQGSVNVLAQDVALIQAPEIQLKGNIVHTGDMQTSGVHQDSIGFHTGGSGPGALAVTANTDTWQWTMSLIDAAGAGQVGLDAVAWVDAREIHLSMMTSDARDMTTVLKAITIGHEMILQAQADGTKFGRYTVIGESKASGGWWTFPVRPTEFNATPPFKKNDLMTVTLVQPTDVMAKMAVLERRIAELEAHNGH